MFSAAVCLPLEKPDNGGFVLNDADRRQGTIAKYFCDVGYALDGDATRFCVDDGSGSNNVWRWDKEPTCVRKLYLVLNSCFL